jgi:hypothetical protein
MAAFNLPLYERSAVGLKVFFSKTQIGASQFLAD